MVKCYIDPCPNEADWAIIPENGSGISEYCTAHAMMAAVIQIGDNVGFQIEGVPHAGEAD